MGMPLSRRAHCQRGGVEYFCHRTLVGGLTKLQAYRLSILSGAILPEHLARFQLYADRVRAIGYPAPSDAIHPSIWTFLLARRNGSPLIPRLRELATSDVSLVEASVLVTLISPSLRVLDISFEDQSENPTIAPYVVGSLLQTLPLLAPDLESFSYDADFTLPHGHFESLRHFTRLKVLSVGSRVALNAHALQAISTIMTVQDLTIVIDLSGSALLVLRPYAFKDLTRLRIRGHFDHLNTFVLAGQFPSLARIKLQITDPPAAGKLVDLFAAVSQHCAPQSLESFTTHFLYHMTPPTGRSQYLEPLLAFPNMTSFHILFVGNGPSFHNDDLVGFARAWPRLTTLVIAYMIKFRSPQHDVVPPSLSAIIEFAQRCPNLRTLRIPELDAMTVPDKSAVPIFGHGLRCMTFKFVSSVSPLEVATVLDRLFPEIDLEDARITMGASAKEVLTFLEAMRRGRENGRLQANLAVS